MQDVQVRASGGGAKVGPGRGAPDTVTHVVLRHGEPCKQGMTVTLPLTLNKNHQLMFTGNALCCVRQVEVFISIIFL